MTNCYSVLSPKILNPIVSVFCVQDKNYLVIRLKAAFSTAHFKRANPKEHQHFLLQSLSLRLTYYRY